MRILPISLRPRAIGCDDSGCDWRFAGELMDSLADVRYRARQHGWVCNNPGPGRPASDRCPRHVIRKEEA